MRLDTIARLYRVRLKTRVVLVQELFAVLGIAVGVALLFSSQVASSSLNGSVGQLTNELVGSMQFQLDARGPAGFDERLLGRARALPGVRAVLPVLERQANVIGPAGQQSVELVGADARFARDSSPLLRHFGYVQLASQRALALPSSVAHAIGAQPLAPIGLQVGAVQTTALFAAELSAADIGELVHSQVAVAPLAYAQRIAGMPDRITRLFVQAAPGHASEVRAGLQGLAGLGGPAAGALNVEPADFDARLFAIAAAPANQGEALFAGISALVGFLFAINAMLMTLHLRQALILELRTNGATRWDTVKTLLFDALVLGGLASLLGLALGEMLSMLVFSSDPGYLLFAFPVGSQRIVTWQSVAIAAGAGLLAACVGVLTPLREIWSRTGRGGPGGRALRDDRAAGGWDGRTQDGPDRGRSHFNRWTAGALLGGLGCLATTTVILLAAPQSAVLGSVTLVVALLLLLGLLVDAIVAVFDRLQRLFDLGPTMIAVVELRSPANRVRSIAIAATGAIAVFGSVAIQGAHANLQNGLDRLFHDVTAVTDLWVAPAGTQNLLATAPFQSTTAATLARLPGVAAVGVYHASFLDYGDRRLWALAPPRTAAAPIPSSQLVQGDLAQATARLREGGWVVLSQAVAAQHDLRIGRRFVLPAPHPTAFRVAALTTNLGWPPGAVILSPADYARAWGSAQPSAYNISLRPGVPSGQVRREVQRALGPASALTVQTARQRDELQQAASRQGLSRLTQIATLVLIATVLAMSAAMGTMIWQRRGRFARMKAHGYRRRALWAALLWESALLLGAGCSIGAAFGLYGQLLISHALAVVTGFPVVFSVGTLLALSSFTLVSVIAVAIVALPGYRVASVAPYT
jgi:putative ABC transport system permease protein